MNFRKLIAFTLLLTGTWAAQAQQRKCEMDIELISPSEGAVIQAFAQYNLTVKITNNGPSTLRIGDTLYYNIPTIPLPSYNTFILQDSIPMNNSMNINLAVLSNINDNTVDETSEFYAKVISKLGGTGSFIDTLLTNNRDANTVTLKPCGPNGTAIHNVNGKQLNFTLFPNPAVNLLQLRTEDLKVKHLIVTDLSGRMLVSKTVDFNNQMELDITTLPAGMYFLKLDTDKGIATAKFIKQ